MGHVRFQGSKPIVALVTALILAALPAMAHEGHAHDAEPADDTPQAEKAGAGPTSVVTMAVRDGVRYFQANGIPNHRTGEFPSRGNPNAISEQSYSYQMSASPRMAERSRSAAGMPFGIALNGVVFDPGTAEFWNNNRNWNYEALSGKINLGVDNSNAHVQPTGAYHYHGLPNGLIRELRGRRNQMLLVGYAADGFPMYAVYGHRDARDASSPVVELKSSWRLKSGRRGDGEPDGRYDGTFTADYEYVAGLGDLDECNGRFGITPEYPEGTYYYVLTEDFPHIPRYFRGTPDQSFMRRRGGGGMGMMGGQGGGQRRGPRQ